MFKGQTATFRRQHAEIGQLIARLRSMLVAESLKRDAEEVRCLVSRLFGKLGVHLAMEDEILYRRLAGGDEGAELAALIDACPGNPVELSAALLDFQGRWPTPESVEAAPERFIRDTEEFFARVEARTRFEDEKLFPMVEGRL